MNYLRYLVLILLGSSAAQPCLAQIHPTLGSRNIINACDYCISSQGLTPIDAGQSGIAYDFRYLRNTSLYKGSTEVDNIRNAKETYVTHQFSFFYRFSDELSAVVQVPFVSRSEWGEAATTQTLSAAPSAGGIAKPQHIITDLPYSNRNTGLSDVLVIGRYKVLSDDLYSLSILGGIKMPTGATSARDRNGVLLNSQMQLGSGSVDPLVGASFYFSRDLYSLSAGLLYSNPTVGANKYKFGNDLNLDLTMRYEVLAFDESPTFFAALGLSGEVHGKEEQSGAAVANTGGTTLYLSPGIRCLAFTSFALEAAYQYPLYHNLNGTQLAESYRLSLGAQYWF